MKRGKIILILILMSISISVLVYSFAYTTTTHTGEDSNYLMVSEIMFGLNDSAESINLEQQTPTIDKFGLLNESFSFSITNTSDKNLPYTVRLIDKEIISTIPNEEIRYQLTRNGVVEEIQTLSNGGALDSGTISSGDTIEYSLIVWLGYNAVSSGGTWEKVASVEAGTVNIDKSGANPPALLDNMIPVYYDSEDDVWRKADGTNSNSNYKWYDYDERMWANAVTVYNTSETDYFSVTEGTEISMDDITMFYVWIPRFKYDLFESGSPKMINVTFEKGIENTGTMKCILKNGIETCDGEKISYTHPAFTFDGEELTGYWINKFELSPEPSTECYNSTYPPYCDIKNLELISKPNLKSIINTYIGILFYNVRNMELKNNIHGFLNGGDTLNNDGSINNDKNNYDIHLSKNFESAALAYLTYSKYGKYSNSLYAESDKMIFNNTSYTKTGSSYVNEKTYDYNIEYYGTGASTTGNIYGVYDLNGVVPEFVMANVLDANNNFFQLAYGASKFDASPLVKYYDGYIYTTSNNGLVFSSYYGDSNNELRGFSNYTSDTSYKNYPFLSRNSIGSIGLVVGSVSGNGGRSVITVNDIYITKW